MPFPVPGLPAVTASHVALLVADQTQCAGAVTVKLPVTPSLLYEALLGESSSAHDPSPSWVTATFWPATVSVPVRAVSDGFAVRLTFTTPLPVPFAPLVIDIQPLSDTAVQVQWLAVVTLTDAGPPVAPTDSDHDGIPDSWAIAHGLSPTGNPGPEVSANGYTNLENYLNELAGDIVFTDTTPPAVPVGLTVS